jgi:type III secretion protein O
MKYALQDLLRVRDFREENASREVRVKQHQLNEAIKTLEQKKKEVEEYRIWRVEKEVSLYDEIINKIVGMEKLDELKLTIARLREREAELEKEVLDAQKAKETAEKNLEKAKESYAAAVKDKKKIETHKEIWTDEMLKEADAALEKEMEDFRTVKHPEDGDGEEE